MSTSLKMLLCSSAVYLLTGTVLAVHISLPADFGGFFYSRGHGILLGFVTIYGTALSAPLVLLLVQATLTVLAVGQGRTATVGVVGLTLMGAGYIAGQLGDQVLWQMLSPSTFDLAPALIVAINLVTSIGMLVLGGLEWRRRRQQG